MECPQGTNAQHVVMLFIPYPAHLYPPIFHDRGRYVSAVYVFDLSRRLTTYNCQINTASGSNMNGTMTFNHKDKTVAKILSGTKSQAGAQSIKVIVE